MWSTCLISSGRAFHSVGALGENALYPYVLRLHLGTIRSFFLEDLRFLLGMYGSNSSHRYRGPKPFSTLKTRSSILKSIRAETGSQCRLRSTGVTCSYLLVDVSRRAAEFCTYCSLLTCDFCRPDKSALQWSNFDEIKAWISTSHWRYERNFLILVMLRRWKKAVLQILLICTSIESTLSSQTPMFLADLLASIISAPIRIEF